MIDFVKPRRPVSRVFLHCSASDAEGSHYEGQGLVDTIDLWHRARKMNGIGYHFVQDKTGRFMKGRSLELIPAAQEGNNTGSIAICVHGLALNKFTAAQKSGIIAMCREINAAYSGMITFHGHCEVSAKSCPVFPYKEWLKLDKYGRMPK